MSRITFSPSGSDCSPSPMLMASKNGAYGSGLYAHGPPPSTNGSSSARSSARIGKPAKSIASSTLVAASSCGKVMPMASNAAKGAQLSIENRGNSAWRNASHISGAGKNPRSAAMPSWAFTAFTKMRSAWLACPSSYVSG